MEKKPTVGGQAVIEGVMMRGEKLAATAVRAPDGKIIIDTKEVTSLKDKYPIFKLPFIRGAVSLFESLVLGMKALSFSAQTAGDEDETLSDKEIAVTMIVAFILAAALFIAIPTGATHLFKEFTDDAFLLNLLEGVFRMIIFLLYIIAITQMKDIKRVFSYHGAEHKTIFCFEHKKPLTVENARQEPRLHPRCGTAFLLIVMLIATVVFAFTGWPDLVERVISRILLLPVIAGISYEILKFSANSENSVIKLATLPGLWLQYLTTKEPDDDMLEVAIESLKAVLPEDEIPEGSASYL